MSAKLAIFDLDGTLYRGQEPVPGAAEAVAWLRGTGWFVRALTNNSGLTRGQIAEKLQQLGFDFVEDEVEGTGPAAAEWCKAQGYQRPFIVGEPGLVRAFEEVGLSAVGEDADVVVAGICRTFTYAQCNEALQCLRQGAAFLATNTDATYPVEGGREQPGAGAIVGAIQACSGVVPKVLGKPEPDLVLKLIKGAGASPDSTWMIGDRYETDIVAGQRAGCHTVLMLTGVSASAQDGQLAFRDWNELMARFTA